VGNPGLCKGRGAVLSDLAWGGGRTAWRAADQSAMIHMDMRANTLYLG